MYADHGVWYDEAMKMKQQQRYEKINEIIQAASDRFVGKRLNVSFTDIRDVFAYSATDMRGNVIFDFSWNGNTGYFSAFLDDTAVLFTDPDKLIEWLKR